MSERPRPTAEELNEFAGAQPGGSLRAALANAMVGLKKQYYGRVPTLLADGKDDQVRAYRLSFQETVGEAALGAVAELTGRKVLTNHSQIVFDPARIFEIFVLEAPEAVEGTRE
jgi:hypothetical protein